MECNLNPDSIECSKFDEDVKKINDSGEIKIKINSSNPVILDNDRLSSIRFFLDTLPNLNPEGIGIVNIKFNEGDLYFKNFETCKLDSKEIINKCRIGYRIWGKLNSDASNIIVFPTWHNGTTESLYKYGYIGSDGIVDSDDYLVIAIESFGNGISSSPSNSEDFPEFSIKDIVTFQHRLLKKEFNIDNVHAIVGVSMGGHITYEWMTEYPDFASKFLPIEGAPWHTNYDMLLYVARENALNGDFSKNSEILKATKTITALDGLMLWTPDYVEREYGNLGFDDWFNTLQKRGNTRDYLVNRKSQNDALISHDIRQDGVLTQDQICLLYTSPSPRDS